jgi:hypothetical protein
MLGNFQNCPYKDSEGTKSLFLCTVSSPIATTENKKISKTPKSFSLSKDTVGNLHPFSGTVLCLFFLSGHVIEGNHFASPSSECFSILVHNPELS